MWLKTFSTALLCCLCCLPEIASGQLVVQKYRPLAISPEGKHRIVIDGTGLDQAVRVVATKDLEFKVIAQEPTKLELEIQATENLRSSFGALWLADDSGASDALPIAFDPVETTVQSDGNYSSSAAQMVVLPAAIDGFLTEKTSHFYAVELEEGALLSVDLIAQRLLSNIDGVVRVRDAEGKILALTDDTDLGPDPSFEWQAPKAGKYFIEIYDSKHKGNGSYRLRLGAGNLVQAPYPPKLPVESLADNASTIPANLLHLSGITTIQDSKVLRQSDSNGGFAVVPQKNFGLVQAITTVPFPVFIEPEPSTLPKSGVADSNGADSNRAESEAKSYPPMMLPTSEKVGIAGRITRPGEIDRYQLLVKANNPIRIRSHSQLLQARTLVKLRVLDEAGNSIAESPFQAANDAQLDFAYGKDGPVTIEVSDWLHRGEETLAYYLELEPRSDVNVSLKPDPALKDKHLLEYSHGAFPLAVTLERLGYEGPVELRLPANVSTYRIHNPIIPAGAKEARIFIQSMVGSESPKTELLELVAFKADGASADSPLPNISSSAFLKAKFPTRIYRQPWTENGFVVSHVAKKGEVADGRYINTTKLPNDLDTYELTLPKAEFEPALPANAVLASIDQVSGWAVHGSLDDTEIKLQLSKQSAAESPSDMLWPDSLTANLYWEHEGFGRIQKFSIPLQWLEIPPTIDSFPNQIALFRLRDEQKLLAFGNDAQGFPKEWTQEVKWTSSNSEIVAVEANKVIPKANGNCEVIGRLGKHEIKIPVKVELAPNSDNVEFENEVLVALSKQGCNSGACHGSPSGKGGFRLSLRAFDKIFDELTLTSEYGQRRLNTIEPEESLLLQKGIMKVSHGGGIQMRTSDEAYKVLRDWIAGGAKLDAPDTARCVRLEVNPSSNKTYLVNNGAVSLITTAHFADGKSRDVTRLAAYESSNINVATVNAQGVVVPKSQGETVILVRFLEHIESIPMVFVEPKPEFKWEPQPTLNVIDQLVDRKLQLMEINSSPICTDDVFVRRVYLDVVGRLPTIDEAANFVADQDTSKRSRLIDYLLEQPEYASFWALKWSDLLRVTAKGLTEDGAYKYHRWIEQAVRENMPYDAFARELLTSSGGTFSTPAANFYRTAKDMNDSVETVSQVFLGARLQCAKCHNHPFERWTQDNYYGLGAFFNRVERVPSARPNEVFVRATTAGDVIQPRTKQVMAPWAPGLKDLNQEAFDRRIQFAQWLIDPSNPYFARVEANRIWSHLFARGIVDPIDDFRDSNPPTNKPLLDELAKQFVDSKYDRKALIRLILNSRTYQTTSETLPTNSNDELYFSHQAPRLLTAEQLLDAIVQFTATQHDFNPLPLGTRATEIPAPDVVKVDFLKVFGQPERSTVCACERTDDSSLGMAIELFNGNFVHEKLKDPSNRFRAAIAEGKDVESIIKSLYQAAYARLPDDSEIAQARDYCSTKPDLASGLEDLCWAIINSDEFLFQH